MTTHKNLILFFQTSVARNISAFPRNLITLLSIKTNEPYIHPSKHSSRNTTEKSRKERRDCKKVTINWDEPNIMILQTHCRAPLQGFATTCPILASLFLIKRFAYFVFVFVYLRGFVPSFETSEFSVATNAPALRSPGDQSSLDVISSGGRA